MSKQLIDNWLNDDLDDESKLRLEQWLRKDPEHLQALFDAVQLQEDLRVHYGERPVVVTLPSQKRRGVRLIVALGAVAAMVAAFFIIPRPSDPRPTADPLVWVLAGNPRVEIARIDPGPNPVAIPREQWPVETRVTISDEPSSLRWDQGCVLEAGPNTTLTLRPAIDRDVPHEPRTIRLKGGSLTVRLDSPHAPVDILAGDSRVRASQPAIFTLKDSGPQPVGHEAVLSVSRGDVELLLPDAKKRSVTAGERVSLP